MSERKYVQKTVFGADEVVICGTVFVEYQRKTTI